MATTEAFAGYGTVLKRGDAGSPEIFTAVAEVVSLSGLDMDLQMIEATHMTSPNAWREYIPNLKDAGELTVEMNFVPSSSEQDPSTGFLADHENRTLRNWQILFSDDAGTVVQFAAYVTGFGVSTAVDAKTDASLRLRITGALTWNP